MNAPADAEALRAEIISAARSLFDHQTAQLQHGRNLDPQRLLQTLEVLTRLLPQPAADPAPSSECVGGRDRLRALLDAQHREQQAERVAELDALRADNARLTEEVQRLQRAMQPTPSEPKAAPDAAPTKQKWEAPESWKKGPPEPWRSWLGDGMSMRRVRPSDWGPI
jgi:hypothetical protein